MKKLSSKRCLVLGSLLAAAMLAGCATTQQPASVYENSKDVSAESYQAVHSGLKPLNRPQVRYTIEDAGEFNGLCKAVIRFAIPSGALKSGEKLDVKLLLQTPDSATDLGEVVLPVAELSTARDIEYLYLVDVFESAKVPQASAIVVLPVLKGGEQTYYYSPVILPVHWSMSKEQYDKITSELYGILSTEQPLPRVTEEASLPVEGTTMAK